MRDAKAVGAALAVAIGHVLDAGDGESRPTAAIPMENPYCSCKLTRVPGADRRWAGAPASASGAAEPAAEEAAARLAPSSPSVPGVLTRMLLPEDAASMETRHEADTILLDPPLPSVGVAVAMERGGCRERDSLADGAGTSGSSGSAARR